MKLETFQLISNNQSKYVLLIAMQIFWKKVVDYV